MALVPGSNAGPYRIVEPLGRGGMASVYKAYEAGLNRHVALKVLPREFLHDPTFAERFRREAQVIALLEHPNIVPIYAYDIDQAGGIPWMAMRLIGGGALSGRLKQGTTPLPRAVAILRGVADALAYAHGKGVVHRDVKPQNILLDEDGRVYLADFGVAKIVEGPGGITVTGMISGTPQYMAPEQASGAKLDGRADIYSLGIVAYELFTGRVPFSADTPLAVLMKHLQEPIPLPSPSEVPEPLTRVLLKSLAKAPEDRWSTASEFAAALEEALALGGRGDDLATRPGLPPAAASESVGAARARRRVRISAVLGLTFLLLVLAVAVGERLGMLPWSMEVVVPWLDAALPVGSSGQRSEPAAVPPPSAAGAPSPMASSEPVAESSPSTLEAASPSPTAAPTPDAPLSPSLAAATPDPGPHEPSPSPGASLTPAVRELIDGLTAADASTRWRSAEALGNLGAAGAPAVASLTDGLRDKSPEVRWRSAEALGKIGPDARAAVPSLLAAIRDADTLIRGEAAKALGLLAADAPEAVAALAAGLRDSDVGFRREAAKALARIGPPAHSAVAALVEALKDKDKFVRAESAKALGRIGREAKAAIPALTAAGRDPELIVAREVSEALKKIGGS
ncbi:MAG: protein kinase [Solirubrobacterales bacterium]